MDVFQLGPVPTPAVAMLTRSLRADLGVMISASGKAYEENGIKLYGPDGYRVSGEREADIAKLMEDVNEPPPGPIRSEDDADSQRLRTIRRICQAHAPKGHPF